MTARRPRLLAALLTVPLLAGLTACGDDDDESSDATEEAPPETTETTETTAVAADADDDSAAAGEVVATVFDSAVPFDDKLASIEGGEAHRADHDGYVAAATAVGGITVEPTDVAVDGDAATVTYRVLFAGTEMYADLTVDVARVDGAWVVPTDAFCGFLASARTPCAAG
jgi:iron complex transport system substrate-binding protein